MAFTGRQDEIGKIGSGEIIGNVGIVSTYTVFEDGLKGGLFAKYNSTTGGVESINGSATPTVAGVVKRDVTGAIEDAGTYTADNNVTVDVIESGLVTLETVPGVTINKFDPVFVSNQGNADDGRVTNAPATGNVTLFSYFYQEVDTNVWAIVLK